MNYFIGLHFLPTVRVLLFRTAKILYLFKQQQNRSFHCSNTESYQIYST